MSVNIIWEVPHLTALCTTIPLWPIPWFCLKEKVKLLISPQIPGSLALPLPFTTALPSSPSLDAPYLGIAFLPSFLPHLSLWYWLLVSIPDPFYSLSSIAKPGSLETTFLILPYQKGCGLHSNLWEGLTWHLEDGRRKGITSSAVVSRYTGFSSCGVLTMVLGCPPVIQQWCVLATLTHSSGWKLAKAITAFSLLIPSASPIIV